MRKVIEVEITNKEARAYILDSLVSSGTLGNCIKTTYLCAMSSGTLLLDNYVLLRDSFEHGGLCSKNEGVNSLVAYIQSSLQKSGGFFLFHNQCALRDDPITLDYDDAIFFGDEVYHLIRPCAEKDDIFGAINNAETGRVLVGVWVQGEGLPIPNPGSMMGGQQLKEYIAQSHDLILGVCDGEAYLKITMTLPEKGSEYQTECK